MTKEAEIEYAELKCKTNFSFLRGASHPEELVERAVELWDKKLQYLRLSVLDPILLRSY